MGDFSRDSFKLTNVMYQILTGETVAEPRHYVGVRLQQGVPLLDADWNELEDIRRLELQACLQKFFGNGIPSGNTGFGIGPVENDNNFSIRPGIALVEGMLVINHRTNLTYADQEGVFEIPLEALVPPLTGIREDLIYLDVWHENIASSGTATPDARLVNAAIGVETCRRIERRWVVRVATDTTDLTTITKEEGHVYLALARVRRVEGENRIRPQRIVDLRRTDLNVAEYLKVPVHVERGTDVVDSQGLADLLDALRRTFLTLLEQEHLFVGSVSPHERTVVYFAVQQITQTCTTGALQARTKNLTNSDALEVLAALYAAQEAFLKSLAEHGNDPDPAKDTFIDNYETFLTGGPGVDGLQTPLAEGDLLGAYLGQKELNAWLSAPVGTLPEGEVLVQYLSVFPFENLIADKAYTVTVEMTSGVTSGEASEVFDVNILLSSDLWGVDRSTDEITLDNDGGTGTLDFTVTPSAADPQCVFTLVAKARNNPTIVSTQPGLQLQVGQTPHVGAILQYAGPALNLDGRMELNAAALTSGFGTSIGFALNNRTDAQHTYTLQWFIELTVGDQTGWSPLAGAEQSNQFVVAAQSIGASPVSLLGPTGGSVVGNIGILHVKLIRIDGADLGLADQESIDVDFIAV